MLFMGAERIKCASAAILLLLLGPIVSSAELDNNPDGSSEIPIADSPVAGNNQPLVRHMTGRFYRGPAVRTRTDVISQAQPTYWQRRYQTPSTLQHANNWGQQHVSQQSVHVNKHQQSGHVTGSSSVQHAPVVTPQSLWQQRERFSETRRVGAKHQQQRFPASGQVKKDPVLHSTARSLFSWDDVPATITPISQPTSNSYSRHLYGIHSTRARPSYNNEENNVPRLIANPFQWPRPRIEPPIPNPPHNHGTSNEIPPQTGRYNGHRMNGRNSSIRPHYPYWLGSDNQTKAAAQEIERRRVHQSSSGTENTWTRWNQRHDEQRRAENRRRFGQNWHTATIEERPSYPHATPPPPPSTTPGIRVLQSPWRTSQYPVLRSRTGVNRGWFKVTNPSADVVFKLKPPVTDTPKPVTQTPQHNLYSYGYTIVPPTSLPHHEISQVTTTQIPFHPSNVYFQENEHLGINGMETRNQQGNYGREILTVHETGRSVHPKVAKPLYSDYNNVLKTNEDEIHGSGGHRFKGAHSEVNLKHHAKLNVDNVPVVHYRPEVQVLKTESPVKEVEKSTRGFDGKGDVTCLHKNFKPAPSVPNSVIKYVRLLEADGGDGGYVEAEYICNAGFRLVAVEHPARLLCKGKEWVGEIPTCEPEPQHRQCSHDNGGCDDECKDDADGRAVCYCKPGYTLVGNTKCEDENECSANEGRGPCQDTCENTQGSFTCKCSIPKTVLSEDGRTCRREDECPANHGCSHQCINTRGGPFCLCPDGYVLSGDWKTCQLFPTEVKKNVEESENGVKSEDVFVLTPKEDSEESEEASETKRSQEEESELEKEERKREEESKLEKEERKREEERKRDEKERKREEDERKREEEERKREGEERAREEEERKREEDIKREAEERKRNEEKKREEEERKREEEDIKRETEERKREDEKKREEEERKREEEDTKREVEERKRQDEEKKREEEERKREEEDIKRETEERKREDEERKREEEERKREKEERKREEEERKREEEERKREEEERKREEEDRKREAEERRREMEEKKREEEKEEERKIEELKREEEKKREEAESRREEEDRRLEEERRRPENERSGEEKKGDGEEDEGNGDDKTEGKDSQESTTDENDRKVSGTGSDERKEKPEQVEASSRKNERRGKAESGEEVENEIEEREFEETELKKSQSKENERENVQSGEGKGNRDVDVKAEDADWTDHRVSAEKKEKSEEQEKADGEGLGNEKEAESNRESSENEIKKSDDQSGEEKKEERENGSEHNELDVTKGANFADDEHKEIERKRAEEERKSVEEPKSDGTGKNSSKNDENEDDDENEDTGREDDDDEDGGEAEGKVSESETEDERRERERQKEQQVRQREEEKQRIRGKEEERQRLDDAQSGEDKKDRHVGFKEEDADRNGSRGSGEKKENSEEQEKADGKGLDSENEAESNRESSENEIKKSEDQSGEGEEKGEGEEAEEGENGSEGTEKEVAKGAKSYENEQKATERKKDEEERESSKEPKSSETDKNSSKNDTNEDDDENEDTGREDDEDEDEEKISGNETEDERRERERHEEQRVRQREEEEKRRIREKEEERQRFDEERRRQREEEEDEERRRQREEDDDEEDADEEEEDEEEGNRERDEDEQGSEGEDREYIDDQPVTEEFYNRKDEIWVACPQDIVVEVPKENSKVFVQIPRPKTSKNISWKKDVKSLPAWGKRLQSTLPVGDVNIRFIATYPPTGSTASCSVLISVKAPEAPRVTRCPQNIHLYAVNGSRSVKANWEDPSFVDNVRVVRLHRTKAPGSRFPVGVTTVTYTASDAAGHTSQCTFQVNVHHAYKTKV